MNNNEFVEDVSMKALRELVALFPDYDVNIQKTVSSFRCMGARYWQEDFSVMVLDGAKVIIHAKLPSAAQLWVFVKELGNPITEAERIARNG